MVIAPIYVPIVLVYEYFCQWIDLGLSYYWIGAWWHKDDDVGRLRLLLALFAHDSYIIL